MKTVNAQWIPAHAECLNVQGNGIAELILKYKIVGAFKKLSKTISNALVALTNALL